ncbi:M60 family metallopeptidase [Chitinophaga sp.]|uniref:M60 family metallopeptidase n=1 Tax=Chitinophaga sp. TaxID=1869181 RepID=UPI0031DF841E
MLLNATLKPVCRGLCAILLWLLATLPALAAAPPSGYFNMIARNVWELTQIPNIATETGRIKTSLQVADFEPVGLRATANTALTVYVEQLSGTGLPKLIMGTYDRQTVATYDLVAGVNTITNVNGGDLYLQYSSATPSDNNKVRVTFQGGYQQMPLYILGSTTHQQWLDMLDADSLSPNATLVSDRVFIVVSRIKADAFRNENQDTLLTLMDRVMQAEGDISGLDNSSPLHAPIVKNKLMLLEKASGNPDATSLGRVRIPTGSINWILSPSYILDSGGWGVFHEIGHHHQHWAWTWSTCIEVCVNIYSLAAKRAIHPGQQGMSTGDWNTVMNYLALPQASKNFNASSVSLFTRLGMFHQLWLAYGDAFYHTLHKRVREEAPAPSGDAAEMRLFMLYACQISGENLGQFFRNWGLNVNQSVYDEIDALGYPSPAIEPSTLREDLVATITSPANGAVFAAGSDIPLTATAFGPRAVTKVEFFEGSNKLGEDTSAPYTFQWTGVQPGAYAVMARVTAQNGTTVTSAAVNVTMEAISVTAPVENTAFAAGTAVNITASTGGGGSAVSKVEFYADSVKIGEAAAAPYSFSWQNAAPGVHTLTARALYQNGDTASSTGVGIVIGGAFPVADAYVRDGGSAGTNFGNATSIVVKKDGNNGYSRISYLKFDLSGLTNPGITKLRLSIIGAGSSVTGTQWQVWKCDNDSWTETGINWNNKPATTTLLASLPGKRSGVAEWDISAQVAEEAAGDKTLTLAIVSSVSGQTNDATFHSREAAEAILRPVLLVDNYPGITLIQPANGDTLTEHQPLSVKADAGDDRQVDSVTFYMNGQQKAVVTTAPYEWNWADAAPGTYGLRARVTDSAQLSTWSDSVTVVVVKDTIAPLVTAPPAITAFTEAGAPEMPVSIGQATATDNGSVATITHNAPALFPLGLTTVTWTATDRSGNTATATQAITVQHPKSTFGPLTIFAGTANGNDNTRRVDFMARLYLNGALVSTGTLLNQPISGNGLGNCQKFLLPLNADSITYTAADVLQLKILVRCAGGNGSFSIKCWYNEDSVNAASKGFSRFVKYTPTQPAGTFFYLGRQMELSTSSETGEAERIICLAGADFREVGTWSTVPDAGPAGAAVTISRMPGHPYTTMPAEFSIKAYPNPSAHEFTLTVQSESSKVIHVKVMDVAGRLVKQLYTTSGQLLRFGQDLKAGIYFVEVQQAEKREVVKLIKQ